MSRRWLSRLTLPALTAAALLVVQGFAAQGGPGPVRITVIVGTADAEVWLDGTATKSKGTTRTFFSPSLKPDRKFSYEIRAKWTKDDKEFDEKRKVSFRAGDMLTVDFTKPETGGKPPDKEPEKKTLYERLGGEKAIAAVVDDFLTRGSKNPKVNVTRKGTGKEYKLTDEGVAELKKKLVDFIGEKTGGPQKYTGESMKEAHKGMKITNAEFDAAGADLKATLNKFKVPAKEQEELLK